MEIIGNILEEDILKPSQRKLTFLYFNLCDPSQYTLCVGSSPDNVLFGNPEEALGIIQWKNKERFETFWKWLDEDIGLCSYGTSGPIFNLSMLGVLVKKHKRKGKPIKKEIVRIKEISGPQEWLKTMYVVTDKKEKKTFSYFLHLEDVDRLIGVRNELLEKLENPDFIDTSITIKESRESGNKQYHILTLEKKTKDKLGYELKCLALKGIETLNEKKPYESKWVFWSGENDSYIKIGGYLESPNIRMLATRTNALMIK